MRSCRPQFYYCTTPLGVYCGLCFYFVFRSWFMKKMKNLCHYSTSEKPPEANYWALPQSSLRSNQNFDLAIVFTNNWLVKNGTNSNFTMWLSINSPSRKKTSNILVFFFSKVILKISSRWRSFLSLSHKAINFYTWLMNVPLKYYSSSPIARLSTHVHALPCKYV